MPEDMPAGISQERPGGQTHAPVAVVHEISHVVAVLNAARHVYPVGHSVLDAHA